MSRPHRHTAGGVIYHALNRSNARATLFRSQGDYAAFDRMLGEARKHQPMRILAYCIMPNHWHMVLWPEEDGDLTRFLHWVTSTHAQRWHRSRGTAGTGHVYQGRFRAFPVEEDEHFLRVCRYAERNPLTARLVDRAEQWRWSSLWRRVHIDRQAEDLLARWPVRPSNLEEWLVFVNQPNHEKELAAIRRCTERGSPYGSDSWSCRIAKELGLQHTLRGRGRPGRETP